jgi:ABC-type proline/glycine betaine transport system substrate-binding protein
MFRNHRARRVITYVLLAGAVTFTLSACSKTKSASSPTDTATTATTASAAKCGTVTLADNAWVGYEANLAVVSYVLNLMARFCIRSSGCHFGKLGSR